MAEPEPVDEDAAALAELAALNGGEEAGGGAPAKPWLKKKGGKKKKKNDGEWNWRADFCGMYSVPAPARNLATRSLNPPRIFWPILGLILALFWFYFRVEFWIYSGSNSNLMVAW